MAYSMDCKQFALVHLGILRRIFVYPWDLRAFIGYRLEIYSPIVDACRAGSAGNPWSVQWYWCLASDVSCEADLI